LRLIVPHSRSRIPPSIGACRSKTWADAEALRSSIAFFAASHADVKIDLPSSLAEHPSATHVRTQLQRLTSVVDSVIEQSPSSPFHLGSVEVNVAAPASTPSLVSDSIDQTEIAQHDFSR
jgi:hypothetical protein